jgi:hypothetical protein
MSNNSKSDSAASETSSAATSSSSASIKSSSSTRDATNTHPLYQLPLSTEAPANIKEGTWIMTFHDKGTLRERHSLRINVEKVEKRQRAYPSTKTFSFGGSE